MKLKVRVVAPVLILVAAVAAASALFLMESQELKDAPLFTVTDVNGEVFSLSNHRGEIVVIDFMATWCVPCKEQIEELKAVYEHFRGTPVVIISISVSPSDSSEKLADYRDSLKAHWIFAQGSDVGLEYRVKVIPTLVIVDGNGKIRFRHEGVIASSDLINKISELLDELGG